MGVQRPAGKGESAAERGMDPFFSVNIIIFGTGTIKEEIPERCVDQTRFLVVWDSSSE